MTMQHSPYIPDFILEAVSEKYQQRREQLIQIHADSHCDLNILVDRLNQFPKMVIQLEGHTDYVGNANSNMDLSERRVQSVKKYLISKNIDGDRVLAKAFGGSQPLSREDTPEAHSSNRRVEVRIINVE